MFSDIGSGASLAGVVISLLGLGFAILQIIKVRGEARAAREAAEAARAEIRRELTAAELTRLNDSMGELRQLHYISGAKSLVLTKYAEIDRALNEVYRRHPKLNREQRTQITQARIRVMQMNEEVLSFPGDIPVSSAQEFNTHLADYQTELLSALSDALIEPPEEGA